MTVAWSPVFSIQKVRNTLPSFVPPPGKFSRLNQATNLAWDTWPALYGGASQKGLMEVMWENWSGHAFNPDYGTLGCLMFQGGGHSAGEVMPQGVVVFELDTLTWKYCSLAPTAHIIGATDGSMTTDIYSQIFLNDNSVLVTHTYDGISYSPQSFGNTPGGKGGFICLTNNGTLPTQPTDGNINAFCYDLTVLTNCNIGNGIKQSGVRQIHSSLNTTDVDLSRGGWWHSGNGSPTQFMSGDMQTVTTYTITQNRMGTDWCVMRRYPPADVLIFIMDSTPRKVFVWSCGDSTHEPTQVTIAGTPWVSQHYFQSSFRWSPTLGRFYASEFESPTSNFPSTSGQCTISYLIPPPLGQEKTGTWTWQQEVLNGWDTTNNVADNVSIPDKSASQLGDFNGLVEIPAWKCFIRAGRWDTKPQLFRSVLQV